MEGRIESEVGGEGIKQERGEVGKERKEGKRSGGRAPR